MAFGAIEAGKAFVKFLLDDKQFSWGSRTGKSLRKWGAIGLAATGPIIAGFTACVAAAVRVGGQLDDMSKRTGLSAESLSELRFAAAQTGTDLGAIERARQKRCSKKAFRRLNSIASPRSSPPFPTIRIRAKSDGDFRQRVGQGLLPLLQDLPRLREEARRLGVTMSDEDVAAADHSATLGPRPECSSPPWPYKLAFPSRTTDGVFALGAARSFQRHCMG